MYQVYVNSMCLRTGSEACEPYHLYYSVIIFRLWDLIVILLNGWVEGWTFVRGDNSLYMKVICGLYLVLKLRIHEDVSTCLLSLTMSS